MVQAAETLADREENLAVPLAPDFEADDGNENVDEATMYAKVMADAMEAKELQKEKEEKVIEHIFQAICVVDL